MAVGTCGRRRAGRVYSGGCSKNRRARPLTRPPPPTDVRFVTVEQRDVPVFGDWVATLDGT